MERGDFTRGDFFVFTIHPIEGRGTNIPLPPQCFFSTCFLITEFKQSFLFTVPQIMITPITMDYIEFSNLRVLAFDLFRLAD